jgi:hypothetical protein
MKSLRWFLVGFSLVLFFQACFVSRYNGDWTVLVRVGADKPHRELIEKELGPVTCVDALGHDGQINYLIARDPFNRRDTSALMSAWDNPPYRFRRILYPLLAGGFGGFSARGTVCGLLVWMALGGGLITGSCASLCSEWKLPQVAILLVLLNPGIYLSAQVLTNDVLATGLALAGVALWNRRLEFVAGLVLAAAVLARETSILVSLCLALTALRSHGVRAALSLVLVSCTPYLCWTLWVKLMIPGGNGLENLGLPFVGLYRSVFLWRDAASVVFGTVTVLLLGVGIFIAWKTDNMFIKLSCLACIGLAALLSTDVWGQPGNTLRALTPLWVFVAIGYGTLKSGLRVDSNEIARPLPNERSELVICQS